MSKPILAVVHIYYPEMWDELKSCLNNITLPYDLYVTTVEQNQYLQDDVINFKSDAHFEVVENRGYDVGPFIHIINQINLDKYEYVIKLHTKRDLKAGHHFRGLMGSKWRNKLLSFLKNKEHFIECINNFKNNPKIGMLTHYKVIVTQDFYDKKAQQQFLKFIQEKNWPIINSRFVAGTIFIARSVIFKDLQELKLQEILFPTSNNNRECQLAHVIERLLGYLTYKNNMLVTDCFVTEKHIQRYMRNVWLNHYIFHPIIRFFFQKKITKSDKLLIKICKIPVFSKRLTNV